MSNGNGCPNCERLEKALAKQQARFNELERKLDAVVKQLDETIAKLGEVSAKLAAATRNSTNSSKPPSSDIVKPSGQKDYRSVRPAIAEDELDWLTQHSFDQCPCCGGPVTTDTEKPVSRVQREKWVQQWGHP